MVNHAAVMAISVAQRRSSLLINGSTAPGCRLMVLVGAQSDWLGAAYAALASQAEPDHVVHGRTR